MSPLTKQVIYGTGFTLFVSLVVLVVYSTTLKPAPTCFDGKKNQTEEEVDCGGPCKSCRISKLSPLKVFSEPKILQLDSGYKAILAEILNSNDDYAAKFSYRLNLRDSNNTIISVISGNETIYAGQIKYIYNLNSSFLTEEVSKIDVEFTETEWFTKKELPKPDISEPQSVKIFLEDGAIKVSGILKNQSSARVSDVKLIAIVFNKFNKELFSAETLIGGFDSFEDKSFLISFPKDASLENFVDPSLTKVIVNY